MCIYSQAASNEATDLTRIKQITHKQLIEAKNRDAQKTFCEDFNKKKTHEAYIAFGRIAAKEERSKNKTRWMDGNGLGNGSSIEMRSFYSTLTYTDLGGKIGPENEDMHLNCWSHFLTKFNLGNSINLLICECCLKSVTSFQIDHIGGYLHRIFN